MLSSLWLPGSDWPWSNRSPIFLRYHLISRNIKSIIMHHLLWNIHWICAVWQYSKDTHRSNKIIRLNLPPRRKRFCIWELWTVERIVAEAVFASPTPNVSSDHISINIAHYWLWNGWMYWCSPEQSLIMAPMRTRGSRQGVSGQERELYFPLRPI